MAKTGCLKRSQPQSLNISLTISLLKWMKQNRKSPFLFSSLGFPESVISTKQYLERSITGSFSLGWFWVFIQLDLNQWKPLLGSFSFWLAQHFGNNNQLRLLSQTEITGLVYILTLSLLNTHEHPRMLWVMSVWVTVLMYLEVDCI